jgi:hypothetical protein
MCVMNRPNEYLIVMESPLISNGAEIFRVYVCVGNIKLARKVELLKTDLPCTYLQSFLVGVL